MNAYASVRPTKASKVIDLSFDDYKSSLARNNLPSDL